MDHRRRRSLLRLPLLATFRLIRFPVLSFVPAPTSASRIDNAMIDMLVAN